MAENNDTKSDDENQVFVVPKSNKTFNLADTTSFGLDVASVSTTVGLDIAKLSTKMGFLIAKRSLDAVSWLVNPQSGDEEAAQVISWSNAPISALLAAASAGVSFGEAVSIGSMNVASTVVTTSLETAKDSIETLNTLFGSTDTARCLEEFVQLVKREWVVKDEDRHLLPDKFADFTLVGTIKALTAWAAIQKVTDEHWNRQVLESCTELAMFTQWLDDEDSKTLCSEDESQSDPTVPLQEPEDKETMMVTGKEEDEHGTVFEGTIEPSAPMLSTADVVSHNVEQNIPGGAQYGSRRRGSSCYPFIEDNDNNIEDVLHNLKRYSKFSMGAYGRTFMRMFGLALPPIPTDTSHINPNFITFAHYTSTSLDNVIGFPNPQEDTVKTEKSYAPSYYLIKDHDSKTIILSFRGTFSLNDLAVDLTCEYDDFVIPGDQTPRTYRVHSGMHRAAKAIYHGGSGILMTAVKQALVENEGYGLVLVGHSLGAAIASILTLMLASPESCTTTLQSGLPPFRPVKTYCLASPCCMDIQLSERSRKLITSMVYSYDVITRLSLGSIRDLRTVVAWLTQDGGENELSTSIIRRALNPDSNTVNWMVSLRAGLEAKMQAEKLYPPGTVYWVRDHPVNEKCFQLYRIDKVEKVLNSLIFGRTMISDHWPHRYEFILSQLQKES
ncbi:hypothetical protein K450DRAFT_248799 [Umbelopsis ramanniana AG]|uniref:sn-1-specific diacylglycerol lipase n=1 Tax=Umbelopsis ramanniana AG TaxID=1314678 RepID=A0AAD5HCM4_UMBRA|nr:uncharacterized protein K450DRAFT_248799 [Umbelopsis ramanniana AG]KAI8578054.1 hypothetical protein K450DRAFT_248799 [Umbelopsis ramanniana AG]